MLPVGALVLASVLWWSAAGVSAQASTPTPAPPKTPTPAAISAEVTPELTLPAAGAFEPLTQADLSVLTGNVQRPNGIFYLNNFLYIACTGDGTVYETQSQTGQTRTYIYGVMNAHNMVVEPGDPEPVIWAADYQEGAIKRLGQGIDTDTIAEGLQGPWDIITDGPDDFLVSNLLGNTVVRVSRAGDVETVLSELAAPAGLTLDGDVLYVANNGSTRRSVEWYDLSSDTPEAQPLVTGLQNSTGLRTGADGFLYIAYAIGTRGIVGRVDAQSCREQGGCTNEQVEIVLYTELEAPLAGLTITPDMRLFVHTMFNPSIYWGQLPPA